MRLALKELLHSRKKYLLVEIIVVLMMFMVLLLSGLVQGLGRAVSSGVETMDADTFVMSDDSEKLLTVSSLTDDEYSQVKSEYGNRATTIDIQRMYLEKDGSTEKVDVTYFAIDPEKFLNPDVYEGERLSTGENEVVLDDSFESDGISVGDTVKDASSGIELKVVGFTKDKMYGHVAVAYVSTDTYRAMMLEVNPMYKDTVHAVAVQGAAGAQIDGTAAYTKAEVVQATSSSQMAGMRSR